MNAFAAARSGQQTGSHPRHTRRVWATRRRPKAGQNARALGALQALMGLAAFRARAT